MCIDGEGFYIRKQNLSVWSEHIGKPIVWLTEYRTFGWLLQQGAFFSTIVYSVDGIDYEEQIENDEYELWEDYGTDYEYE